jgi:hypothetical protein
VFKDSHNLPTNPGIARILHLDRHGHVSRIVQSNQRRFPQQNDEGPCKMAPRQAIWSFVHLLAEKRVSGATGDLGTVAFGGTVFGSVGEGGGWKNAGKGKGCDIGYALATSSCEGANSVESCTVTALDAITAFAVPNPNYSSQSRRFFQVWLLIRLPF